MTYLIESFVILLISIILVFICSRFSILNHNAGESHQNFVKSEQTPLIGGIIFFIFILIDYKNLSLLHFYPLLILIIGVLSDARKVVSVNLRFLIQLIIIISFVHFYEVAINNTRVHILDNFLKNYFLSVLFTTFCVLIIVNGSNFIDGSNIVAIGYFLILESVFIILNFKGLNMQNVLFLKSFTSVLLIIFFLNALNKLYLGDGGSYLFGFIYSVKFISLYLSNPDVSPFFIILIIWYPAFEILFSILRKLNFNKSPIKPDSNHLHQLIYFVLIKKISNNILRNNLVGIIINFFNLIIISISLSDIYNTQFQIFLITFSISVYVFVYIRLLRIKLKKSF